MTSNFEPITLSNVYEYVDMLDEVEKTMYEDACYVCSRKLPDEPICMVLSFDEKTQKCRVGKVCSENCRMFYEQTGKLNRQTKIIHDMKMRIKNI